MNSVTLLGRLVRDPETRYSQAGKAVTRFIVAVDRPKMKGQEKAEADFITCIAFGKTGEVIGNYLAKGSRILVTDGCIRTGNYKNKNGDTVYTTDVWVNNFEFVDSRAGGGKNNNTSEQTPFSNMGEEINF